MKIGDLANLDDHAERRRPIARSFSGWRPGSRAGREANRSIAADGHQSGVKIEYLSTGNR
ncbi:MULTISPECIES: hypothetical protein [unclassified Saccharopolyspora]|uniref:hypothetical protein n=1 Tax=unclassified Saccharopolyspora TaxID=2646250 RepID=UPI001CD4B0EF|nr:MULTISPECIES: hypothetical protein [unclassified Saccharopolyspora]MCA1188452.1 hypothetical protein [Saccharopolyspora sp. 6T]MCA1190776.1 hypothetical protein [Saccharopolyspora sp. 6V]MCA1226928.1 hypothetical protein [Saccharopolyspora sp. 6M]